MSKVPRATYRLQLNPDFTLDEAAGLADYLAALGISHLYLSPCLQATPGSAHGYDVVDYGRVNDDLGGTEAHRRLCNTLRNHDLGQVLDIVPNHMAITGPENVWWRDVLENGPSSPYADYFDVDWDPPENRSSNIILIPILGDRYGRCLEAGEIRLRHEAGRFFIQYYDHWFPVAPHSLADILDRAAERSGSDQLAFIADSFRHLPLSAAGSNHISQRRHRNKEVITLQLARLLHESPECAAAVEKVLEMITEAPRLMDIFLEEQNYRLAFWQTAARDLGYRRFFDINTLVGLRAEEEDVFRDTHHLILQWLSAGVLDGLRIDHADGLRDPEQYLCRLREAAPDAWIVVEKILHPGEDLPCTWPVAGTVGYDFLNLVGGLFINSASEKHLTDFYADFTGEQTDYLAIVRDKKRLVTNDLFAGDITRLTALLLQVCEGHFRYRDYTRYEWNEALGEIVASFPVYRTYVRPEAAQVRERDRETLSRAAEEAAACRPDLDPDLFEFLGKVLLLEQRGDLETEFVLGFQQVTGPIMAKGVEDTAFYCFNRLVSLNEVGGDPSQFGTTPEAFHQAMQQASSRRRFSVLATSTHDTKRSEDIRTRLAVLSEIPEVWTDTVRRWSVRNEVYRRDGLPDRNAEYLLYQTLVGAWPLECERVLSFMEKAAREAKVYSSWTQPNAAYEGALAHFIEAVFDDREFITDVEKFVGSILTPGKVNSLSQVLIKLTAPGVPDFYQGTELWNLFLVDPDNRRPVDFELRRRLLAEIASLSPEQILARMDDGLPKLWVIFQALQLRSRHSEAFADSNYLPLTAFGEKARHVVAFRRGERLMTIVPRLVLGLKEDWGGTWIELPEGIWRNELTGDRVEAGKVMIRDLLRRFPVALLWRDG